MKRVLDPRIEPLLEKWMSTFHLGDFVYDVRPLPKKLCADRWADCRWNLEDKAVTFRFGPTVGVSDQDIASIIVHECMHGVLHTARQVSMGSLLDEQLCNLFAMLFVPESSRPFPSIVGVKPTWASANFAKTINIDEETYAAIIDVLPSLVVRLSEPERSALVALFYDLCPKCDGGGRVPSRSKEQRVPTAVCAACGGNGRKGLRTFARERKVHVKTVERWRDQGIEQLRQTFLNGNA